MNIKQDILIAAEKAGLGVKFTQSKPGEHARTSRIYIFLADQLPRNCRSKCVIRVWEFSKGEKQVYSDVLSYLEG